MLSKPKVNTLTIDTSSPRLSQRRLKKSENDVQEEEGFIGSHKSESSKSSNNPLIDRIRKLKQQDNAGYNKNNNAGFDDTLNQKKINWGSFE